MVIFTFIFLDFPLGMPASLYVWATPFQAFLTLLWICIFFLGSVPQWVVSTLQFLKAQPHLHFFYNISFLKIRYRTTDTIINSIAKTMSFSSRLLWAPDFHIPLLSQHYHSSVAKIHRLHQSRPRSCSSLQASNRSQCTHSAYQRLYFRPEWQNYIGWQQLLCHPNAVSTKSQILTCLQGVCGRGSASVPYQDKTLTFFHLSLEHSGLSTIVFAVTSKL